jgi:signal peptidase I
MWTGMQSMLQWRLKLPVKNNIRLYTGRSMKATFRPGDCLIVETVPLTDIYHGDVVVYRGLNYKGDKDELVHRVMCALPNGLVVQGDNNPCADKTLVTENNLVGKVSYVLRGGKKYPVRGKRFGLLRARALYRCSYIWGSLWDAVRYLGRGSYSCLRNSGLIARFWHPSIKKVQLITENGILIKYVCRNRTVAYYRPANGWFKCRKPYDLVLATTDKSKNHELCKGFY